MMDFFQHIFEYRFLNRALLIAICVGVVCGVVGSVIILRGLALMSDAMSHAVLPGVALSYLFQVPILVGSLVTGMLSSLLIGFFQDQSKTKKDAAIGICFTAFLATGIILISLIQSTTDLYHILFGNILAITNEVFWTTIIVSVMVLLLIIIFYRPLMLSTFDAEFSRLSGLNTTFIHYFIILLLALVTIASIQTVGIILVVAMLITPASTAYLFAKHLHTMMIFATLFSTISAIVGIYLSYIYNLPSGACIVLCAFSLYIITFFIQYLRPFFRKEATS
ncbi:metal ABC transporter permease [Staphylococcus massiliensis]|uniref:Manganese transport system membrane protein MntC n=1 Tax=Staphylococcus massiliensis S46 TaxID=1229783 RepID=K9B5A8_9STAP|nr:metal ABC transporter permease [Staphylococcus massiliensis]EKU50007.1 ABC transporter permease [Staphylococcus massiliensis S46]MCG3399232.1 metal ABC transporter permease [Staphylococcus massiliensis]MCG3413424.1 metal ABC transporter permease [Staphylococcus massiliensis]POA00567.1 metal ABC transporter permease [Staphylococcus massiliensis CCUG 55927]